MMCQLINVIKQFNCTSDLAEKFLTKDHLKSLLCLMRKSSNRHYKKYSFRNKYLIQHTIYYT